MIEAIFIAILLTKKMTPIRSARQWPHRPGCQRSRVLWPPSRRAICGMLLLLCGTVMAAEESSATGKHLFILSGQSNMREPLPGAFTEAVSQVFGKDNVLVVTYGIPSQPIRAWYKLWAAPAAPADSKPIDTSKNGQLYDQLLKMVQSKITGKKITSVTFVWMQGEADAQGGWGGVYEQSFYGILDQFKNLNVSHC